MLEFRKDLFADERDDNLNVIGKGEQRQDMLGHVTGRTRFFDDHGFDGLLHLKVRALAAPSCPDPEHRCVSARSARPA